MKTTFTRRYRRRSKPAKSEGSFFKKESQPEPGFFAGPAHDGFFQPANTIAGSPGIQRKCGHCEQEEKKGVLRKEDKKEDDKKLQRAEDKKKDDDKKLMRAEEPKKEEDKKLQRVEEPKKEDDKKLQRAEEPKKEDDKKLQRVEEPKKEDDKKLQKKEAGATPAAGASVSNYIGSLSGKGNPMSPVVSDFFASRMGYDFSGVKIHTDKEAAESAKSVNAKAYTIGNNIVFNDGQYNTSSLEGNKLLAHELVHVMQNDEANAQQINRKESTDPLEEVDTMPTNSFGIGSQTQNTTHYANCAGVSVQGHTNANYSNSFTSSGTSRIAGNCSGCAEGDSCVVNTGTIVSTFTASPTVTLPSVPPGLSPCEAQAVQQFINTPLRQHELQHVAAFNTYNGIVRTRYTYTGCASGLDAFLQSRHDAIEVARRAASDAQSAALDPFNATIPCNCPDPNAGQNNASQND